MDFGMMALIFVGTFILGLTIAAFCQVGWFYSVLTIVFTSSVIILVFLLWKKASKLSNVDKWIQAKKKARIISNVFTITSGIMIAGGLLMFLICFLSGPTSFADTFTECGWCGGSGIVSSGKLCSLCNGAGGALGSAARFTPTIITWLGVLIAVAGILIIVGTKHIKDRYD